jgi:protein-L-isoaspartate(D-aspartate) O-methyltransferase
MSSPQKMIQVLRKRYGFESQEVIEAMLSVPREEFVDFDNRDIAYNDRPVDIGYGQTMSQPYTVAFMTSLLLEGVGSTSPKASRGKKVLEIGTGSGYQAAVLSRLMKEVYTVEIVRELALRAGKLLAELKFLNVFVKTSSGEHGWEEHAPYDGIMITAGVEGEVPQELFDQLKVGGVLVAPVGVGDRKVMTRYRKPMKSKTKEIKKEEFGVFSFVPFVRE